MIDLTVGHDFCRVKGKSYARLFERYKGVIPRYSPGTAAPAPTGAFRCTGYSTIFSAITASVNFSREDREADSA